MNPLLKFFVIAYVAAWPFFLAAALPALSHVQGLVVLVGTFAPGAAALWLTWRAAGAEGARALVARLFEWRVAPRWYLFAFGYLAFIRLTVAVVHRVSLGAWPEFWGEPWYVLMGATILSTVVGGQAGEELGRRGICRSSSPSAPTPTASRSRCTCSA